MKRLLPMLPYKAVIVDIEGTITDIDFVKETLFPYATQRLAAYVREQAETPIMQAVLQEVRHVIGVIDAPVEKCIEYLLAWAAADKKITPLKTVQGYIWQEGYATGAYQGHLYADAIACLQQWQQQGIALFVYSSGSVAAQKLLFQYSVAGDIRALFKGFFDTKIGSKIEAVSYQKIVQEIGYTAAECVFFSDNPQELLAAQAAGLAVYGVARENHSFDKIESMPWIDNFVAFLH